MSVLPKVNDRFNTILVKIPASCFVEIDRLILQFVQRNKRSRVANLMLKEKNEQELHIVDVSAIEGF